LVCLPANFIRNSGAIEKNNRPFLIQQLFYFAVRAGPGSGNLPDYAAACKLAGSFLIFFATLFLYNLDNLLPYKTGQQMVLSERKKWLLTHRKFLKAVVTISGLAAFMLFLKLLPHIPLAFILPVFLVSILYSLPFLPGKNKRIPLRDVPFLKVFLIAGVWSALTVLLPLLIAGENLDTEYNQTLLLRRFLFIFALTLLFDIRDVQKDKLSRHPYLSRPFWYRFHQNFIRNGVAAFYDSGAGFGNRFGIAGT
jgi:hypothetical protein